MTKRDSKKKPARPATSSSRRQPPAAARTAAAPQLPAGRLTTFALPVADITEDPDNANGHGERNLRHIERSMRTHEQQEPLVVRRADQDDRARSGVTTTWITVSGAGRLVVARDRLGWPTMDCLEFRGSKQQARRYAILANQTVRTSKFIWERLAAQLLEFEQEDGGEFDAGALGFEEFEANQLMRAEWQPPTKEEGTAAVPGQAHRAAGVPRDPHADLAAGDKAAANCAIVCTPNQREVIDQAIERVRLVCDDLAISEGRCMELLAFDYLAGAPLPELTREQIIAGAE